MVTATKWAIQTVNREVAYLTPVLDKYIREDETPTNAPALEPEKAGVRSRMVAALGKFFRGVQWPGGFLLPIGPVFLHSQAFSVRERAWLEAYWKFGPFV